MLRWYVLFAVLLLTAAIALAVVTQNRLEEEAQNTALVRAHSIARQLAVTTDASALVDMAGLNRAVSLTVLSSTGEILDQAVDGFDIPDEPEWQVWQRSIAVRTAELADGYFVTTDPDNNEWLHVTADSPDGARLILIQQPASGPFTAPRLIVQIWAVALLMFLAGGGFSWWLVSRQIIAPMEQLEAYSGVVRWRGRMRPDEQAQIDDLAARPDQIGSLARSLKAMEDDINRRFVQLSTLLETSRVVAASLDLTEVIDNILDQVQNLFNVERCAVVVLDRRADVFRIRASRGLSEGYVQQLRIAPSEPNSLSMRALRNEMPIQVADTETDLAFSAFRPRARAEGYQSVLAIPLFAQHAAPAVLLLYKAEPYRYSYSELELASSFGNHASIAMENAALFARSDEQLQEQTRRLEAIVESLQDGLLLESVDGRVLYCNQPAAEWLGLPRRETQQQTSEALIRRLLASAADPEGAQRLFANAYLGATVSGSTLSAADASGLDSSSTGAGAPSTLVFPSTGVSGDGDSPVKGPRTFDLIHQSRNGRRRDLRIHLFDVSDARGELLGRGQLWQDISSDKEIDRMKSTLLSTVSHELRTPLATIKGYASTLLASDVQWDAISQREFLQTISDETDRLAKLVTNLLDMSRIEAGLLEMNCELYSLDDLLQEVARGFNRPLNDRLQTESPSDLPPIAMDVSRIGTAMRNLVENAAKYSPPEKPIELSLYQENGNVLFSVRDYGPGVPADYEDKIFDRFVRADNRLTRRVGGAGLGLAICKGFVEAHHGQVWVRPARPGAIFGFTLPIEGTCED